MAADIRMELLDAAHVSLMSQTSSPRRDPRASDANDVRRLLRNFWHVSKNGFELPPTISIFSRKVYFWHCESGHQWTASVFDLTRNGKCSYCSGRWTVPGVTDLPSTHPQIMRQWHWKRNIGIDPTLFTSGSNQRAWWICRPGHEWELSIKNKLRSGPCPFCDGDRVCRGDNDLETILPELAKEWHPVKNGDLRPSHVTISSNKKVWWRCAAHHEWEAVILNRKNGGGCPGCTTAGSSRNEKAFYAASAPLLGSPTSGGRYPLVWSKKQSTASIDIAGTFRGLKVAIEYDGSYFHRGREAHDLMKTMALLRDGWVVVRIREQSRLHKLPELSVSHPKLLQVLHCFEPRTDLGLLRVAADEMRPIFEWLGALSSRAPRMDTV
jgi:hypothetical protein